jgi:RimJ/RimL family protein N-acetyltransferase
MTGVDGLRIETPRLVLRPLTVDDVPLVLTWAADPDVVRNFSFFANGADPERIRGYIEGKTASPADLLLAVLRGDDGVYCGNVGLHELDAVNDNARLGVILRQEMWGQGLAGEALCGLMDHAFRAMRLHKVYLNVFASNAGGIHLYERLGFVREGVLRSEYKLRGGYQDLVRMSLLADEWPTPSARERLGLG